MDRAEFTYRLPLQEMMLDRSVGFQFIGSRTLGVDHEASWPDVRGRTFDPAHEGYYGYTTSSVLEALLTALPALPFPDIALIHLGTNDQGAGDFETAVVRPLEVMIARLRAKNPRIAIFLGHLNFHGGPALRIRPLVESMASRHNTTDSPVVTVAHYEGWKEHPGDPMSDTFDWVHPNPRGQRKMAHSWLAAMEASIPFAFRRR